MQIIDSIEQIEQTIDKFRENYPDKSISLVPTMGALHQGHLSLIQHARINNQLVIVSIYLNPKQFAPTEDLDQYPKNLQQDIELCKEAGVDILFTPSNSEMYPLGHTHITSIHAPENLNNCLCGASRPHFFSGVLTIVYKLLSLTKPDIAYFGEKDYQQYLIIKQMTEDLRLNTKIQALPIIRQDSGLALSSRNKYLSAKEQQQSNNIYQALLYTKDLLLNSQDTTPQEAIQQTINKYNDSLGDIDYFEARDNNTLESSNNSECRLFIATNLFGVRLIDNLLVN